MAGLLKLSNFGTITLESAGATLNTNVSRELTDAVLDNNDAAGNAGESVFASFELTTGFDANPVVGAVINLYLVPSVDGTNYADADATANVFQTDHLRGAFEINKAQTAMQRMTISRVPLEALTYKAYIWNRTTRQMAVDWTLKATLTQGRYT